MIGYVTKSFPDRGYAFVHASNGQDYFLHVTNMAVKGTPLPEKGQSIIFDIAINPFKGKEHAVNARLFTAQNVLAGGGAQ